MWATGSFQLTQRPQSTGNPLGVLPRSFDSERGRTSVEKEVQRTQQRLRGLVSGPRWVSPRGHTRVVANSTAWLSSVNPEGKGCPGACHVLVTVRLQRQDTWPMAHTLLKSVPSLRPGAAGRTHLDPLNKEKRHWAETSDVQPLHGTVTFCV